ncbi:hypothetical protein POM88_000318 [Heracleum sosnowskyi]|uniref:ACT domain-containing protein ACR n=1 Tax=Heracleum sosnowskyi TaxID=360622 RepID=A0AAD8NAR1_9APIA|nr:hypothetical protein POM88_000318 [Heracleum sosnowskyi]
MKILGDRNPVKKQSSVFHLTDLGGNKIPDKWGINYIKQSLSKIQYAGFKIIEGLTTLELTGTYMVGLLTEVFAVLSDLQVNVVESKDGFKIDMIETQLRNVLKGDNVIGSIKTLVSLKVTRTERRLHKMMFADHDYEHKPIIKTNWDFPIVLIQNCLERGYFGINVYCEDRARLLFDVACTLTDMSYVVFHATLKTIGDGAHMEFFVRHTNGLPISSEAEKQFVSLCLRASIERRASEGVWLELRDNNNCWDFHLVDSLYTVVAWTWF